MDVCGHDCPYNILYSILLYLLSTYIGNIFLQCSALKIPMIKTIKFQVSKDSQSSRRSYVDVESWQQKVFQPEKPEVGV